MIEEEKIKKREYRNEHYPKLYPCVKCYYWRCANGSVAYGTRALGSCMMCHFALETGELRNCVPDFLNERCDSFVQRHKKRMILVMQLLLDDYYGSGGGCNVTRELCPTLLAQSPTSDNFPILIIVREKYENK